MNTRDSRVNSARAAASDRDDNIIPFPKPVPEIELTCVECGSKLRGVTENTPCCLCGGPLAKGDPHPWAAPK